MLADGETDALGDLLALMLDEGDTLLEGLTEGLIEALGLTLALGD